MGHISNCFSTVHSPFAICSVYSSLMHHLLTPTLCFLCDLQYGWTSHRGYLSDGVYFQHHLHLGFLQQFYLVKLCFTSWWTSSFHSALVCLFVCFLVSLSCLSVVIIILLNYLSESSSRPFSLGVITVELVIRDGHAIVAFAGAFDSLLGFLDIFRYSAEYPKGFVS